MNANTYKLETEEETDNFNHFNFIEENRIKELFEILEITDFNFSDRQGFASYDAQFRKDGKEYLVEAKVRNYPIAAFDNHPLLEHKAEYLYSQWLAGKKPLYIQFFQDGAIIYNLAKRFQLRAAGLENHQLVTEQKLMDNNTAKDRGKSVKSCYNLSPDTTLYDKVISYKVNPFFYLKKNKKSLT